MQERKRAGSAASFADVAFNWRRCYTGNEGKTQDDPRNQALGLKNPKGPKYQYGRM